MRAARRSLLPALAATLVVAALPATASAGDALNWQAPQTVSDVGVEPLAPLIGVAPDGTMDLVWRQRENGNDGIVARTRVAGSSTWLPPVVISDSTEGLSDNDMRLATDSVGNTTVVWRTSNGYALKTVTRPAGSSEWSDVTTLTGNTESTGGLTLAAIPDGGVALAWGSYDSGTNSMRVSVRSTDADNTTAWGTPVALHTASVSFNTPYLAFGTDGTGLLGWSESINNTATAHAARYSAGSWHLTNAVTAAGTNIEAVRTAVAPSGESLLTWTESGTQNGDQTLMTARLPAGNTTLDSATMITAVGHSTPVQPTVASDSEGTFVLAYQDCESTDPFNTSTVMSTTLAAGSQEWTDLESLGRGGVPTLTRNAHGDMLLVQVGGSDPADMKVSSAYRPDGADSVDGWQPSVFIGPLRTDFGHGMPSIVLTDNQVGYAAWPNNENGDNSILFSTGTAPARPVDVPPVPDTPAAVPDAPAPDAPAAPAPKPPVLLAPVIEAKLTGRTITLTTKVTLRAGQKCAGKAAATTRFGTTTYRTTVKLSPVGKLCVGSGTIKLRKTPSARTKLRVTVAAKTIKTRTLTTKRA